MHWRRPWCWERLKVGGEVDDRAWDGWMASLTQWTWVWVCSMSWWWTGRPSVLQSMGSQRVGHDWATELNWTSWDTREALLVVQLLSHVQLFVTPRTVAYPACLSFTISGSLLNSCPLSRWCHAAILPCVIPFSSCISSFPASRSSLMSHLLASGGQSIQTSASVISPSSEY